jgi:hypothetical protein
VAPVVANFVEDVDEGNACFEVDGIAFPEARNNLSRAVS